MGEGAVIKNSIVTEGCRIYGTVENSVLFNGVKTAKRAVVEDSVIMSGVEIASGAVVEYSIVDSDTKLGSEFIIGEPI